MIQVEAGSILEVVRKVYLQLMPTVLAPSDLDLEAEDSATIIVDPGGAHQTEAVSLSDGLLSYRYQYKKLFPFADEISVPNGHNIVDFEMTFWNSDLMHATDGFGAGRLGRVTELLLARPDSRRAVVGIWDNTERMYSENAPCTTHIFFRERNGVLEMHSHLRANDICFLLFMDMQVLSGVHKIVADLLGLKKGLYIHFVDSLHIRKENRSIALKQYDFILRDRAWRHTKTGRAR